MAKLAAFDSDDLLVISAHLERAKIRRADMAFLPKDQRFVMALDRPSAETPQEYRPTGLHFERVTRVMTSRDIPQDASATLTLLGMTFEQVDPPSGYVVLLFEGGGAIRLSVECLEAAMMDLVTPSSSNTADHA
jgi:hypothetical protein